MNKPEGESKTKRLASFGWYDLPENNAIVRFCQDSGLHGLKYITGPTQHLCERLFWVGAVIMATVAGSYLIYDTCDQYYSLPIVFTQNPKQLSIREIPFPSVTVCGLNRVKKKTYEKYYALANQGDGEDNTTVEEAKYILKILDSLCDPNNILSQSFAWYDLKMYGMGFQSSFLNLELSQRFQNKTKIMDVLKESSPRCGNLLPGGLFNQSFINHNNYVEQVETEFGICCTFNTIRINKLKPWKNILNFRLKNFSMDTLIPTNKTKHFNDFPRQQNVPGLTYGMSIFLETNPNELHCNSSDSNGFLMSIANPLDAPSIKQRQIVIEFNTESFFTLKPKITLARDSIKRFTPENRGCYFDNEMMLKEYSVYTKANCWQECIADLTMKDCQVLAECWFDMHRSMDPAPNWIYGHLCEPKENCTKEKRIDFFSQLDLEELCKHCLPTCNDIKYAYNIQQKPLKQVYSQVFEKTMHPYLSGNRRGPWNRSLVHVYFDEYDASSFIQKDQFGIVELLANSGGLLGLCLGFSGLSILEIIYYFTIRVCFRRLRRKVLSKTGLYQDDPNPKDNANEISYLHMQQTQNEEAILQLQKSFIRLQNVLELKENVSRRTSQQPVL